MARKLCFLRASPYLKYFDYVLNYFKVSVSPVLLWPAPSVALVARFHLGINAYSLPGVIKCIWVVRTVAPYLKGMQIQSAIYQEREWERLRLPPAKLIVLSLFSVTSLSDVIDIEWHDLLEQMWMSTAGSKRRNMTGIILLDRDLSTRSLQSLIASES